MLQFKKNTEERKTLATRLGELTGIHPVYTRAPHYAYQIGDYWIDRDGNLTVEEDKADMEVLETLMGEGLILPSEEEPQEHLEQQEEMEEVVEAAPSGEAADETEEETAEVAEGENQDEPEDEVEDETAEADTETDADEGEDADEEDDLHANFNLPLEQHTGLSLRNLFHLLYSRGPILNKATGGNFRVEKSLVDAIADDACIQSVEAFRNALGRYEAEHGKGYEGIELGERWLTFSGFGISADVDHLRAYGQLAILMNQMALGQKRIQAKEVVIDNEKYAFRVWLIRLGMNGEEFKQARKLLMENLGGHAAFRTEEEAERAKQKALAKRRAAREGGGEPQADTDAAAEEDATQPDTGVQVAEAQEQEAV